MDPCGASDAPQRKTLTHKKRRNKNKTGPGIVLLYVGPTNVGHLFDHILWSLFQSTLQIHFLHTLEGINLIQSTLN